jgi:hypothetical protein
MTQRSLEQPKESELLKQLIGEWAVGIAMKIADGKVISGCGEMTAVEIQGSGINSELNMHIEGYDDYFENDLWSFDRGTGKVHLFSVTSEGDSHDQVGDWKDDQTLELNWRGTYKDQYTEEQITANWVTKDQIELKETNYSKGKTLLTTDYVFKRKEPKPSRPSKTLANRSAAP